MGNGLQQGGHEAAGARHRDVAELGGGQRRERVMLHFEEACWAHGTCGGAAGGAAATARAASESGHLLIARRRA